jgi:hypothetical protein
MIRLNNAATKDYALRLLNAPRKASFEGFLGVVLFGWNSGANGDIGYFMAR